MAFELSRFEIEVMDMLLAGENDVFSALREQYYHAAIQSKKDTGEGFYITFSVSGMTPRISDALESIKPNFCFGDVEASIPGLRTPAGFLLWVRNGYLKQLEGYTFGERWPSETTNYALNYRGGSRNIEALQKEWTEQFT